MLRGATTVDAIIGDWLSEVLENITVLLVTHFVDWVAGQLSNKIAPASSRKERWLRTGLPILTTGRP